MTMTHQAISLLLVYMLCGNIQVKWKNNGALYGLDSMQCEVSIGAIQWTSFVHTYFLTVYYRALRIHPKYAALLWANSCTPQGFVSENGSSECMLDT